MRNSRWLAGFLISLISRRPSSAFLVSPQADIGRSSDNLLKFSWYQPLNRQSGRFKCEGIELATSTLADQVGRATVALTTLFGLIHRQVFAVERLHGNDIAIDAAYSRGVTLDFSRPGKPTNNAFIEAFNGRLRVECLNAHWFLTLADAAEKLEAWRRYYNEVRPHGALGQKTPISLTNHRDAASPSR
jgi:putative transposase